MTNPIGAATFCAARKLHRCWLCGEQIHIGERYGRRCCADDDGIWVMKFHPECAEFAAKHWDTDEYEYHDPSEFVRPLKNCAEVNA